MTHPLHVTRLSFGAPWSLVIRGAAVFEASVHGPGAAATSIDYLPPSTLAGVLASLAFEAGRCSPALTKPGCGNGSLFSDQDECLRTLLGVNYHVYAGFLEKEDEVLVYTPRGYVAVEQLAKTLQEVAGVLEERGPGDAAKEAMCRLSRHALGLPKTRYVGIALSRGGKSVVEGMLYTMEKLWLHGPSYGEGRLRFLAFISSTASLKARLTVKLGAENKPALLEAKETSSEELKEILLHGSGGCTRWLLYLASPAILEEAPSRTMLSPHTARSIGEKLLEGASKVTLREPYMFSLSSTPIEALMPGWSMSLGGYRCPAIVVPPGTILYVEAARSSIESLVHRGLGGYTSLGWGTSIAICASEH